jgi:hypothetical protein
MMPLGGSKMQNSVVELILLSHVKHNTTLSHELKSGMDIIRQIVDSSIDKLKKKRINIANPYSPLN